MAFVRRLLRVLVKRLNTTLAVAQRIVRFLLSTFRHIRSRREMWSVAETLLRSLIPEVVEGSTHRTVEERDELEVTSNTFGEEISTKGGMESLSSNPIGVDHGEKDVTVMSSSHCLMITGKFSTSMLSTIMETSEEDDTEKDSETSSTETLDLNDANVFRGVDSSGLYYLSDPSSERSLSDSSSLIDTSSLMDPDL
ncbi:uncharacterized protein [Dysidea avara]|uniref:uncharacterized protein n=1 Tax=Dysidea avara TaxID=196820 RepID=UPI00331AEEE4